ncbi:hypothetical protein [Tritonibacter sp. SIMBA_163]|uniref:hypothetical protein n=2 Tax=Pseudomonadota TaxID=1224 RepID=UPI00398084AD
MKDIARYERTIGELLEENTTLSSELEQRKQELQGWYLNRQDALGADLDSLTNIVLRLAEQQGRQFDSIYRLLADRTLKDRGADLGSRSEDILNAFSRSAGYTDTLSRIISGRLVENITEFPLDLAHDKSLRALRGTLVHDDQASGGEAPLLVLSENTETGVHSMIFPVAEISATAYRGVELDVKPMQSKVLRIRVRQSDNWKNYCEVNVDLHDMRHLHFRTSHTEGRQDVVVKKMDNGWVRIFFAAGLDVGEGPVEIELIAMAAVERKSSKRKGSGKESFALRRCHLLQSDGLVEPSADRQVLADLNDSKRAAPSVARVDINTPSQERARREKREAYLASGAYRSLTKFRNIHAGKRAFIIGNGPSINNQDLTLLKDEVTFVTNWFVNHPQYEKIDPSYFCVSSHEMFGGWGTPEPKANQDWLQQMLARAGNSHKFFSYPFRDFLIGDGVFPQEQCDFLLFDRPKYQIDEKGDINLDLTQPMDDGYTGIITFCLPLAHYMGIKEIYLVGCDCDYGLTTPDAPKSYFYDFSKHTTKTTSHEGLMRVWADNGPIFQTYEIARNRFLQDGIQIINCTDGGRLEVFPRACYDDIVAQKS